MPRQLLSPIVLLVFTACGEPPMGISVDVISENAARIANGGTGDCAPAAELVPKLVDETGANVDLSFESDYMVDTEHHYRYENRAMYQYSGKTVRVVLTNGDDVRGVVMATSKPRKHNIDIVDLLLAAGCPSVSCSSSDTTGVSFPSYQGSICVFTRTVDTSWE